MRLLRSLCSEVPATPYAPGPAAWVYDWTVTRDCMHCSEKRKERFHSRRCNVSGSKQFRVGSLSQPKRESRSSVPLCHALPWPLTQSEFGASLVGSRLLWSVRKGPAPQSRAAGTEPAAVSNTVTTAPAAVTLESCFPKEAAGGRKMVPRGQGERCSSPSGNLWVQRTVFMAGTCWQTREDHRAGGGGFLCSVEWRIDWWWYQWRHELKT